MIKVKKTLMAMMMVIVWLVMVGMLIQAPSLRGKVAIIATCILINSLLAIGYSCLERRPASVREWFRM